MIKRTMLGRLTQLQNPNALYEDAKRLWLLCFPEDDSTFVEYYFKTRTSPESIFCHENAGSVLSMLHAAARRFLYNGTEYSVRLLAGIATHPEHRGKGLAGQLIGYTEDTLLGDGVDALVLQPATPELFGYYSRFGFKPMCGYVKLNIASTGDTQTSPTLPTPEHCLNAYRRFSAGFRGAFLRDEACFSALIDEYTACGGFLCTLKDGYAFGYETDGVLHISEFVGDLSRENIAAIFSVCNCRALELTVPESMASSLKNTDFKAERVPYNMLLPLSEKARKLDAPLSGVLSFESY